MIRNQPPKCKTFEIDPTGTVANCSEFTLKLANVSDKEDDNDELTYEVRTSYDGGKSWTATSSTEPDVTMKLCSDLAKTNTRPTATVQIQGFVIDTQGEEASCGDAKAITLTLASKEEAKKEAAKCREND